MTSRMLVIPVLVLALAIGACGGGNSSQSSSAPNPNAKEQSPPGDIPDNQAFVRYTPSGAGFSVDAAELKKQSSSGGAVTFTDKLNRVRLEQATAPAAPTAPKVRRSDLPKLAHSVQGFKAGS